MNSCRFFLILTFVGSQAACFRNPIQVPISVHVVDSDNQPIEDAKIFCRDEEVARSDQNGRAQVELSLHDGEEFQIIVRKEDSLWYYAPYLETLAAKTDTRIDVRAVLFAVPKPAAQRHVRLEVKNKTANIGPEKAPSDSISHSYGEVLNDTDDFLVEAGAHQDHINPLQAKTENSSPIKAPTGVHLYIFNGGQPVDRCLIFTMNSEGRFFEEIGQTNARGRVELSFNLDTTSMERTIYLKKKGFVSKSVLLHLDRDKRVVTQMKRGQSLDIFALTNSSSGQIVGVPGVEIIEEGREPIKSDGNGWAGLELKNATAKEVKHFSLRAPGMSPEVLEVAAEVKEGTSLIRFFSLPEVAKRRAIFLPVTVASVHAQARIRKAEMEEAQEALRFAVREALFSKKVVQEALISGVQAELRNSYPEQNVDIQELGNYLKRDPVFAKGLKHHFSMMIEAKQNLGRRESVFEIVGRDLDGRFLASAAMEIANDVSARDRLLSLKTLASRFAAALPEDADVLSREGDRIHLNAGSEQRFFQVGDKLSVWGWRIAEGGHLRKQTQIASLEITEVSARQSTAKITELDPGQKILISDRAHRNVRVSDGTTSVLQISEGGARIYNQNGLAGISDESGIVNIRPLDQYLILADGFLPKRVRLTSSTDANEVRLQDSAYLLDIHSTPARVRVYADGKDLGTTPFLGVVESTSSDRPKIVLKGQVNQRPVELQVSESNRYLSKRVIVERHYMRMARLAIKRAQFEDAAEVLEMVPKTHSDYLKAQLLLAQLYFDELKQPERARDILRSVDPQKARAAKVLSESELAKIEGTKPAPEEQRQEQR